MASSLFEAILSSTADADATAGVSGAHKKQRNDRAEIFSVSQRAKLYALGGTARIQCSLRADRQTGMRCSFATSMKSLSLSAFRTKAYRDYLPLCNSTRQWQDREKQLWLPLFPSYVFVREEMDRQLQIISTPGVIHIVRFGGRPADRSATHIDL